MKKALKPAVAVAAVFGIIAAVIAFIHRNKMEE